MRKIMVDRVQNKTGEISGAGHPSAVRPLGDALLAGGPQGLPDSQASGYRLVDTRFKSVIGRALKKDAAEGKCATPLKNTALAIGELRGTMNAFLSELNRPVTEVRSGFEASVNFPVSFTFKFPFRPKHKEFWSGRVIQWKLYDFVMLKGSEAIFKVDYKEKDGVIFRKSSMALSGATELNNGFWGPVEKDEWPFPERRLDKIELIEAFDKETGKPIPYYTTEDYADDPQEQHVSYDVAVWMSMHDEENGDPDGCSSLKAGLSGVVGVDAKCTKYQGQEVYRLAYGRQLYSIYENESNLSLKGYPGGLIGGAIKAYRGTTGNFAFSSVNKTSDLVLMVWHVWRNGLMTSQGVPDSRIKAMEKGLSSH